MTLATATPEPTTLHPPGEKRAISLETVGMTKIFGSLVALEDVSITVEAGEFHALEV